MTQQAIKIVICDESEQDAEAVARELRDFGMAVMFRRVSLLSDYQKQLQLFAPDLILSDFVLLDFNGLEAMDIARKIDPNIPFIFVSFVVHEASVIETLDRGATDYIFKDQLPRLRLSVLRALRERDEQRQLDMAHEQIRRSEEYFRSLIENASDLILVLDGAGFIQYTGPSVGRLLGYSPEEMKGRTVLDFVHEADRENVMFIYSGRPKEPDAFVEFRFKRKDGVWRNLEAFWKTLVDEKEPLRSIVNAWDVTDRIREQEALRESILRHLKTQTELKQAQKEVVARERLGAIGQMASGIAHDLSNSLMPVLGFCEMLITRPENLEDRVKLKRYLETMYTSAGDAMRIVSSLREFYRKKERPDALAAVNLNKVIEDTVELTQHKWKSEALANGVRIDVACQTQPLPLTLGNETALRQALANIVLNAVDAMPRGGLIRIRSFEEGRHVGVEISDTGVGMDDQTRRRCLEPFFTTKGTAGTGLGLSMVYGVVRRHEGEITIESQLAKGTTFKILIPIKPVEGASGKGSEGSAATAPMRPLTILVVDDEPIVLEVLNQYLTGDGHTVVTAVDGQEGFERFKQCRFDLVVTDRAMPIVNGDQLAEQVKQHSPKTPVLMVTGFGELMRAKNEKPQHVDEVLSKPLKLTTLREAIVRLVGPDIR